MYDANADMLAQAQKKVKGGILISGKAENLPFRKTFLITLLLVLD